MNKGDGQGSPRPAFRSPPVRWAPRRPSTGNACPPGP